jgi:hypothetical protein
MVTVSAEQVGQLGFGIDVVDLGGGSMAPIGDLLWPDWHFLAAPVHSDHDGRQDGAGPQHFEQARMAPSGSWTSELIWARAGGRLRASLAAAGTEPHPPITTTAVPVQ